MNINWDNVFSAWSQIIEAALVVGALLLVIVLPALLFFGVVYVIGRRFEK